MEKIGRTILTVFFLLIIFVVGAGTALQSKSELPKILEKHDFKKAKARTEDAITENMLWRYGWVNVNGLFHRVIGTTIVRGSDGSYDVYKLSNGQIMYNKKEKDITEFAENTIRLRDEMEDRQIHFIYAQLPFKIKDDSYMPPGTTTGGNKNGRKMVKLLREADVDVVDICEEIEEAGFDWTSLFFKTDHHWKPKTGMWASGLIMKRLAEEYGYQVDPDHYDYDSYTKETYENYMLGAVGRRVGAWYDGLDDIDIVDPSFRTSMKFWGVSDEGETNREGGFRDAVYYWENLEKRSDFVRNSYSTYIGKEFKTSRLVNRLNPDGPRILLIRDSFSCVIQPFIALDASEVIAVDLRRNKTAITKLCDEYDPDIVLLAYNSSAFTDKQFNFFRE